MAEACRDRRSELAALALGRLDEGELVALRAHLDGCADCRGELRDLVTIVATLPLAEVARIEDDPFGTPGTLEQEVLVRVARERDRKRHQRRVSRLVLAAAVIVGVALPVGAIAVDGDDGQGERSVVFAPIEQEDRAPTGTAELHSHSAGTEIRLRTSGLDADEWYWVWLTDAGGSRVAAGTLRGAPGESVATMTVAMDLDKARRLWVTDSDDQVVLDARW